MRQRRATMGRFKRASWSNAGLLRLAAAPKLLHGDLGRLGDVTCSWLKVTSSGGARQTLQRQPEPAEVSPHGGVSPRPSRLVVRRATCVLMDVIWPRSADASR